VPVTRIIKLCLYLEGTGLTANLQAFYLWLDNFSSQRQPLFVVDAHAWSDSMSAARLNIDAPGPARAAHSHCACAPLPSPLRAPEAARARFTIRNRSLAAIESSVDDAVRVSTLTTRASALALDLKAQGDSLDT